MVTKYSNEEIKSIYRFFSDGIEKYVETLPQYFKDEISQFGNIYKTISELTSDNEGVKIDVSATIKEKNEWVETGYKLIKAFYYSVKGTDDKTLMSSYFGVKKLSDIETPEDILNISEQVKTVNKNDSIKYLDEVIDKIINHYDKGCELFKKLKSTKILSVSEVKGLSDAKEKFSKKYNKLKYLLKGYFYDTDVNTKDFFTE